MTQLSILAVNVFGEENKTNETTPQQNTQKPADQPDAKTPSSTEQGTNTTTTQVVAPQDDNAAMQNALSVSVPWIAAGIVAIVILIALFTILRRLNKKS